MVIFKTFKKSLVTDGIVVGIIIVAVLLFAWISGSGSVGWEIEKGRESVENDEREISENIYIHNGGELEIKGSSLIFDSEDELSIWVEGNGDLTISDSTVDTDEAHYSISAYGENGDTPSLEFIDTSVFGHLGIFLRDNSNLESENSNIGRLIMMDRSDANITGTTTFLILDSEREENYSDLTIGEEVDLEIESREGWKMKAENSSIEGYQINIDDGDNVEINNSSGIDILFNLVGVGENGENFSLPTPSVNSTGETEAFGYKLSWIDTTFNKFGFVLDDSVVSVSDNNIGDILLTGGSQMTIVDSDIDCFICNIFNSTMRLNRVFFIEEEEMTINLFGSSSLEISDSDITNVNVILSGSSNLTLENCEYDDEKIENIGTGEVTAI